MRSRVRRILPVPTGTPTMERQPLTSATRVLLPRGASPASVIVCEQTGRWAVGLRREFADRSVPLVETRSLADCGDALRQSPASLVVIELTEPSANRLVDWMFRLERDFPLARAVVVARPRLAAWERLLREAGAVHVATSVRRLAPLACVALRHIGRAPLPELTVTERIWARLPWPRQSHTQAQADNPPEHS